MVLFGSRWLLHICWLPLVAGHDSHNCLYELGVIFACCLVVKHVAGRSLVVEIVVAVACAGHWVSASNNIRNWQAHSHWHRPEFVGVVYARRVRCPPHAWEEKRFRDDPLPSLKREDGLGLRCALCTPNANRHTPSFPAPWWIRVERSGRNVSG